jgi:hypothetical protein
MGLAYEYSGYQDVKTARKIKLKRPPLIPPNLNISVLKCKKVNIA